MGVAVLHKINSQKQLTGWIYLAGHSLQTSDFLVSSLINELNKILDMCSFCICKRVMFVPSLQNSLLIDSWAGFCGWCFGIF